MPLQHLLLAVAVMMVWGSNFVVIEAALRQLPPLLLATLRFALVFAMMALFVRPPKAKWRNIAAYGVLIGAGQFGLLFLAMRHDITPGLASLVVQAQAFFTIALTARGAEAVRPHQWAALALATAGMVVIFANTNGATTPLGVALVLGAALSWAGGNVTARAAGQVDMLGYIVWSSLFAVPPLLALSLVFEGAPVIAEAVARADATAWAAVVWQAVGNTLFGYTAWQWLMGRYPPSIVAPMALLVPVFGMGASAALLGEPLPFWKLAAMALVLAGLGLNVLWPQRRAAAVDKAEPFR
ncbi:MAG: EamA family transporter [Hyphomonadaceae bacterium]